DTVMGVEQVRYANGAVASLAALAAAPAPLLTTKNVAPEVLPALPEDKGVAPLVLPGEFPSTVKTAEEPLVLPGDGENSFTAKIAGEPLVLPGDVENSFTAKTAGEPLVLPGDVENSFTAKIAGEPLVLPGNPDDYEVAPFQDSGPMILPAVFDTGEVMQRLMDEDPFLQIPDLESDFVFEEFD
ncbi:hypothetical protein N0B44_34200, partial [Roseibacterium beibuensis]|nr:hypothetical protein [Roseibacterium beibuensis]